MADPNKRGIKVTEYVKSNKLGRSGLYDRVTRYTPLPESSGEMQDIATNNAMNRFKQNDDFYRYDGVSGHYQMIPEDQDRGLGGNYVRLHNNKDLAKQYGNTMGRMFNVNSEDVRRTLGDYTSPRLMGTNPGINQDILDDYEAAYDDYNYDLYDANLEFGKGSHPDGNSDSPWRNNNVFMQPGSKPWQRKQTIYQKHYPSQQFRLGGFIKKRF